MLVMIKRKRPANGRIGAPSLAEDIRATVDFQALAAWTVDNDDRRDVAGGGLHAVEIESRLQHAPLTAAMTSGKYSGKQPAMTALAAIFSMVAMPFNGGITPSATIFANPPAAIIASTAARVGGNTGSPSLQPRLTSSLNKTAGSLETVTVTSSTDGFARALGRRIRGARLTLP